MARPLVLPDIEPATQLLPVVGRHAAPAASLPDYAAELPAPRTHVDRRRDPLPWTLAVVVVTALVISAFLLL